MKSVGEKIRFYRERKGFSLRGLSKITGIPASSIHRYEIGDTKKIPMDYIPILEKALSLDRGTLMGWEETKPTVTPLAPDNIYMRPVYNSAAAGFNVLAEDTIIGYMPTYITAPSEQEQYIWVNVVGDSMSPLIDDGSKILVKMQESVDSGQIAVALIDGEEAVVKRVEYGKNWIELISTNPYYPPRRFSGPDVQRLRIIGLVKEVSKSLV